MDFTKRIFTFIFLWLIFSCVLLDHPRGFEVQLSRRTRRSKHKSRKTKGNHHQYVKQMANLFSRLVVCTKCKKCFVSCLFIFSTVQLVSYTTVHTLGKRTVSVAGAGRLQECKSILQSFYGELRKTRFCESGRYVSKAVHLRECPLGKLPL